MNNLQIILIHGSYGNPEENWFPWLKARLQAMGHLVVAPQFPTPEGQHIRRWKRVFIDEVGTICHDTVLIGHSIGCAFILNLLEESMSPAKATFLVAGFAGNLGLKDFDDINKSFACHQFKWTSIQRNAGIIRLYSSDNDPYVPLAKAQELAKNLSSELTIVPNGGHLNASSGFLSFPQLLDDLQLIFS